MENKLPIRKQIRLKGYDYSLRGAYFVTICVKGNQKILWQDPNQMLESPEEIRFSKEGLIVKEAVQNIEKIYLMIKVEAFAIMPNHVHLLLNIHSDDNGNPVDTSSIDMVVRGVKNYTVKQIGRSIWQRSFNDHIVRGRPDHENIAQYIYLNPVRWSKKIRKQ